ncbi:MAG: TolB family protein [Candidatus Hodarchaeota archaeon]
MMRKQKVACAYLALCVTSLFLYSFLTVGNLVEIETFTIIDDGNITDHLWSPDGTKIAYIKCLDGQITGELWVAEWDGKTIGNKQMIYTGVYMGGLEDWRDDGWILFRVGTQLHRIRENGSDFALVTYIRSAYYGRFIPGTDLVFFSGHPGGGWWRPLVCNADGSGMRYIAPSNLNTFTVCMSPTGNKLFIGDSWYWDAETTMYSCNPDGSGLVNMGAFAYRTGHVCLADGNTVLYYHVRTRNKGEPPASIAGNIYAMDSNGANKRVVIDDEYINYPEFNGYHPIDGQTFLMRSNRDADGNMHIFQMNADGTGIVQLTKGPYNDGNAMYSPDGEFIMYNRLPEDYVPGPAPYPYELVIKRVDVANPWSSHPDDQTVDRMESDVNIIWYLYDDTAPGAFIVLRNGIMYSYPLVWINDSAIVVPVDTSKAGDWNYTIVFTDEAGNPGPPDTVWITVLDVIDPWSSHPDDQTIGRMEFDATITWYLYDDVAPGTYTVLRNDTVVEGPTVWTNDTAIVIKVCPGPLTANTLYWNYTIVFTDAAGNDASDTCIITVIKLDTGPPPPWIPDPLPPWWPT